MLDLYIMRHAKSSWKDERLADFDRPLNKRGMKASLLMGRLLSEAKICPDLLICSKAKRCKQTLQGLIGEGFSPLQQIFLKQLYFAKPSEIISDLQSTADTVKSLMIIGHNPMLVSLITTLVENKTSADYLSIVAKFPTCAFAHLKINKDCWTKLAPNSGSLYCYMTPKQQHSQDS